MLHINWEETLNMMASYSNCTQYYEYCTHNLGIDVEYDIIMFSAQSKKKNMINIIGEYTLNTRISYSKCILYYS